MFISSKKKIRSINNFDFELLNTFIFENLNCCNINYLKTFLNNVIVITNNFLFF